MNLQIRPAMNKHRVIHLITIYFVLFTAGLCDAPHMNADDQSNLQFIINNPSQVNPISLKAPANREIYESFKTYAIKNRDFQAFLPLIRAGDGDVIKCCVSLYHSRDRFAGDTLGKAGNPDIIALIGDDLNRHEPADAIVIGDWLTSSLSVQAAEIIKRIILHGNAFSPEINTWAKTLPRTGDGLRQPMKIWWNQNKALLMAKRYDEAKLPR